MTSPVIRQLLKSKLHRATVTEANVDYVGSVTIDRTLLDAVDLWPGEYVHIWNVSNGARFETYTLEGEAGSGVICLNGAAALKAEVGHKIIIAAFAFCDEPIKPKIALLDDDNRVVKML
jgi:aspartate 1-decarboxylase